jgi:hypothetical protein
VVDLLKLAEWAVVRTTLRVWTVGPVAREGFLHLQDAANIDVIMMGADLGAKTTPLLLIFENLRRKGWGPQSEARPLRVLATPMASSFSFSMLEKRCRPCFQVLDTLGALFERGLTRLTHTQSPSYYSALLSSPAPGAVLENERAAYYEPLVREERLVMDVEEGLDYDVVLSDDEGAAVDVLVALPAEVVVGPVVAAAALAAAALHDFVVASSSSDSSSSSSSTAASDIAVVEEPPPSYLADYYIGAYIIHLDEYVDAERPNRSHTRYQITCRLHGARCKKRRGVGFAHERRHGRVEPAAYCLAWANNAHFLRAEPTTCSITHQTPTLPPP